MYRVSTASPLPNKALPLSLCIVTNVLDARLERIIDLCSLVCTELLIGYDHKGDTNYHHFTENRKTTILPITWQGYAATKNNLAAQAKNDWILSLDGDEIPDDLLLEEISKLDLARSPENQIFYFKRVSILGNDKILFGSWGRDTVLRLYNRRHSNWKNEKVHEDLEQHKNSQVLKLRGVLYHYTAVNYQEYTAKNKKYARLSAEKYFAQGKQCSNWQLWAKTAFTFIKEYLLQLGFLDGIIGFRIAKGNAAYTYWKYRYLRELRQAAVKSSSTISN